jgi:DNA-binding response OmpR family regulator
MAAAAGNALVFDGMEPESAQPAGTVLVVEDDARIAAFIVKGLRAGGFAVERVATGKEAISRIALGDIAVQVLDLGLPDIDGLLVMRELAERGVAVPVVIVTARTDPRDRAEALALGARFYLTKPFAWREFFAAVQACVTATG